MNAIELETRYSARNYAPLPVVLTRGEGAHLWGHGRTALSGLFWTFAVHINELRPQIANH